MTKAWVSIIGSALAIPAVGLCTLTTTSFHTSLFFMAVSYLVSECWMSPAVTMMQNTVKPEQTGSVVSGFLFYLTIAGCISTVVLNYFANLLGAPGAPHIYGKLIFAWSLFGYLASIPCFWIAGKHYKKHMD